MAYRVRNERIEQAHNDGIVAIACANTSDKMILVTGSLDSSVKVWRQDSLELVLTLEGHRLGIVSVVSDPTGKCKLMSFGERMCVFGILLF